MLVKHTIHRKKSMIGKTEEVSTREGERLIAGGTAIRVHPGDEAAARPLADITGHDKPAEPIGKDKGPKATSVADAAKPGKASGKK